MQTDFYKDFNDNFKKQILNIEMSIAVVIKILQNTTKLNSHTNHIWV